MGATDGRADTDGNPSASGSSNQGGAREQRNTLSKRVRAMRHPLRAQMLRLLVERGPKSPTELAHLLDAKLGDVAYHMKRLKELECAKLVRTRTVRGSVEHFYEATELHLVDEAEWESLEPAIAAELIRGNVQKILDDFVESKRAGVATSDSDFHITRTPMVLDEEGLQEGMEIFEKHRLTMAEIERESDQRRSGASCSGIPISSSLLFFPMPSAEGVG